MKNDLRAYLIAIACILAGGSTRGQSVDSVKTLREVMVTANKFPEKQKNVAQKVDVMSANRIESSMSNNTASLLEQTGKIFVQKSQLGGGSPVIRGFEASRILLVIDGVRMNNAIYRTGHLQNVITIDDDILEKVEVLYGPASTIYGSDALGGVIHLQTKGPVFSNTNELLVKTRASARYSSAYNEMTGHLDVSLGKKTFASLTSISFSNFGNLRQGDQRKSKYQDFGIRNEYIERINGTDSIVTSKSPNVQKFSAYKQFDILEKLQWKPNNRQTHSLNLQYSTSSNIPRYDRLTDRRNGKLRWAEWYYGPQDRLMASYDFKAIEINGFFDAAMAGINYQKIEESRMQRPYRNNSLEHRVEKLNVISLNADLRRSRLRHELSVGADAQFNYLKSSAFRSDINTDVVTRGLDTRYPDGSNKMNYAGIYAQHQYKIITDKLILNDGVRISHVSLNSVFKDTSLLHLPYTKAVQKNLIYSANLGLVYLPGRFSKASVALSTGFRSPNIDDLAKVFESAGGTQLVVPNPDLKPEQTLNIDLGFSHQPELGLGFAVNGYYTFFRNAIVLDKFELNGKKEVLYSGKLTPVVASQNKAEAYIYGFEASLSYQLNQFLGISSHLTYTRGKYTGLDGKQVPLDHIPPLFGKTSVNFGGKQWSGSVYTLYNGWKKLKDYNPNGEDNLPYATVDGMPSWMTLNASAKWALHRNFDLHLAVENILDRNYRVFASGIHNPGRNFVVKLVTRF